MHDVLVVHPDSQAMTTFGLLEAAVRMSVPGSEGKAKAGSTRSNNNNNNKRDEDNEEEEEEEEEEE